MKIVLPDSMIITMGAGGYFFAYGDQIIKILSEKMKETTKLHARKFPTQAK